MMQTDFLNHASEIRLAIFIGSLLVMASLESIIAFRKPANVSARLTHLGNNFLLSVINTFILRFVFPAGLVGIALFSEENSLGVFNAYDMHFSSELLLSVVLLDLCIYWQHRLMHTIPLLWKLHGVHHSDQLMDVSTGFRFHPLEMLFSFFIKVGLVVILGISPFAIIVFEILLSSFALFSHSNIVFPYAIEKLLVSLLVTPAMHRIHHSRIIKESNQNFGFSVNCWDRLFASFQKPEANQSHIVFGREKNAHLVESSRLPSMLSEPFKK